MYVISAEPKHSSAIARLIMMAMGDDCCRYFIDENHTLADFRCMLTKLVRRRDTQYSYLNTLVTINDEENVVGVCVSYPGRELHQLRQPFIDAVKENFGKDFSDMPDETEGNELYIDSLAVDEKYRHCKLAYKMVCSTIEKSRIIGIPDVGLLVDKDNAKAELFYRSFGFVYENDASWGGHPMKHMQYHMEIENK